MASSFRTEAVASRGELALVDGSQGLADGLLHHTVDYRRDAKQAHLAIVLGYLNPSYWVRTLRPVLQGTYQSILVSQEPREHLLTRHLVDTATALVALNRLVGSEQVIGTEDALQKVFLVGNHPKLAVLSISH